MSATHGSRAHHREDHHAGGHSHRERDHGHEHAAHDHEHRDGHGHGHDHEHPSGLRGLLHGLFVPHSHDAADSIDDALEASTQGIRAVKTSLVVLALTAAAQLAVVVVSGSVALLADTIHNFSDALTAVPLWIAFVLGRRAADPPLHLRLRPRGGPRRPLRRGDDRAVGGRRGLRVGAPPRSTPSRSTTWAGSSSRASSGSSGTRLVAVYRIRVGRRIGSAALVADGLHARTDGFTSLAVVLGAAGVWPASRSPTRWSGCSSPSPSWSC